MVFVAHYVADRNTLASPAACYLPNQAVSKDGKSANRLTVMLRLLESTTGSLAPLLALRNAGLSSGDAAAGGAAGKGLLADKQDSDSDDEEAEGPAGPDRRGRGGADSPELHDRLDSRCVGRRGGRLGATDE
jgi:hypothetical protein